MCGSVFPLVEDLSPQTQPIAKPDILLKGGVGHHSDLSQLCRHSPAYRHARVTAGCPREYVQKCEQLRVVRKHSQGVVLNVRNPPSWNP